mgnify:CR=1 FL=1
MRASLPRRSIDVCLTADDRIGPERLPPVPEPNGDDAVSPPLDLGFTFMFFGQPFTQVNVSTNGFLTFGDTTNGDRKSTRLNSSHRT